ncbi:MAG: hypothetical protein V9G24_02440 [Rhodoblastus sp.]
MSTIGPGKEVGGVQVICWSPIDDRHVVTGSCHQSRDGATVSPYAGVAIAQRPGETHGFPVLLRYSVATCDRYVPHEHRQGERRG